MSYRTSTIGALLAEVNSRYFLPAIQRPFVWRAEQIVTLIDSLLKGYPISSFMFWSVDEAMKRELRIYQFIEHWREGVQNPVTSGDGRNVVLVLDGQQRITSLLIALRGTYSEKDKYQRRNNLDAWKAKTLYIDLLWNPEDEEDEDQVERDISYSLRFHEHVPRLDPRHLWFRLGDILNYRSETELEELVTKMLSGLRKGGTAKERDLVTRALQRLHDVIWREEAINFYTETSASPDRVLDIFVRANDGGTPLAKSDLLMSMITSKWASGSAREQVNGFVEHINTRLPAPNNISKDFVLKACLVLCGFDVRYNLANFTSETVAEIETHWPEIKSAIERSFRFLNAIGLSADNLSSVNAVLPIAWFLYHSPDSTLRSSSEFERQNAIAARRWLLNSLLMGVFAGTSDRTISVARGILKEARLTSRNFPESRLYHALAMGGRQTRLDDRAIDDLLELKYGKSKTFLALSVLYDDLDWNGTVYHMDHIIPQCRADRRVLMGMNLPEHRIQEITKALHRLGNLQLLPGPENLEKKDLPFDAWITSRSDDYRARHLIAETPEFWSASMLPEFVRERDAKIRQHLLGLAG